MANLNSIKNRIKSVKSTGKITQAMKMVAAAKVRKAEIAAKESRPYSEFLIKIFSQLKKSGGEIDFSISKFNKAIENYPALLQRRQMKNVAILVLSSDKGLAGGYNSNIIKETVKKVNEFKEKNIGVKLFIVGIKAISALTKTYKEDKDVEIIKNYSKIPPLVEIEVANMIAEDISQAFVAEKVDAINIIYTQFKSMLSAKVTQLKLLPLTFPDTENDSIPSEMLFEPNKEEVLRKLVPLYISNTVYTTLKEAMASELSARMNAMNSATENAAEIVKTLSVTYNKARQYNITQEIIEVMSGANNAQ